MANKEINDLTAAVSLSLTDNFEIQQLAGLSKKISVDKIIDLAKANITSVNQMKYISQDGSDATGDGSEFNPWGSLPHAYSQITDASAIYPYQITFLSGTYTILGLPNVKPFIFVNFNNASLTVAGPVTLDPTAWIGVDGLVSWENSFGSDFFIDWDFQTAGANSGIARLSNHILGGTPVTWSIKGANSSIAVITNCFSFNIPIEVLIENCYGGMSQSTVGNLTVNSSANIGMVFTLSNNEILGDFNLTLSSTFDVIFFMNSCTFIGAVNTLNSGSGNLTFTKTNTVFNNNPTINNSGAGAINLTYDYLNMNPTITGTVGLVPLIPSLIWGKHEISSVINGNPTTVVASTFTQLNTSTPDFENVYEQKGIAVIPDIFGGLLQNNTGRDGWFNIRTNLSFNGVVVTGQFLFAHIVGSTNPPTIVNDSTGILLDSSVTEVKEVTVESDIFLNNGDYVQLMAKAFSAPKSLSVITLSTRMTGT